VTQSHVCVFSAPSSVRCVCALLVPLFFLSEGVSIGRVSIGFVQHPPYPFLAFRSCCPHSGPPHQSFFVFPWLRLFGFGSSLSKTRPFFWFSMFLPSRRFFFSTLAFLFLCLFLPDLFLQPPTTGHTTGLLKNLIFSAPRLLSPIAFIPEPMPLCLVRWSFFSFFRRVHSLLGGESLFFFAVKRHF